MRCWLLCRVAAFCLLTVILSAGEPPVSYSKFCVTCGIAGVDSVASLSGQFVVHGTTLPLRPLVDRRNNSAAYIELNPQMVAVTAERIKHALLDELTLPDSFRHKIHVVLLPQAPPEQPVTIVFRVYSDGVHHQVGIPARIEQTRFIKSLVQVLLSDLASRGHRRTAELPSWLVEGMSQHLLARVAPTIVANRYPVTYTIAGYDRLHQVREVLRTNTCLTFHELSFPQTQMTELQAEVYQASAQLFLNELLKLPDGPKLMAAFIARLPSSLNWQTTLYSTYSSHFQSALDVEKWWALTWIDFKSLQKRQTWPVALALQKLNNVLTTSMQYRASAESIPETREVPLQQLIQHQDFGAQKAVLSQKLTQLYFLAINMPAETHELVSAYEKAIREYLDGRAAIRVQPIVPQAPEYSLNQLVRSTTQRLDQLDARRSTLRLTASASQ